MKQKVQHQNLMEEILRDFPKSEIWRLQTDGWQSHLGPGNFRKQFYDGMNAGFKYIHDNIDKPITPELIEGIYLSAYSYEDDFGSEVFKRGYNEELGEFEIFFPADGIENMAGVSEHLAWGE